MIVVKKNVAVYCWKTDHWLPLFYFLLTCSASKQTTMNQALNGQSCALHSRTFRLDIWWKCGRGRVVGSNANIKSATMLSYRERVGNYLELLRYYHSFIQMLMFTDICFHQSSSSVETKFQMTRGFVWMNVTNKGCNAPNTYSIIIGIVRYT